MRRRKVCRCFAVRSWARVDGGGIYSGHWAATLPDSRLWERFTTWGVLLGSTKYIDGLEECPSHFLIFFCRKNLDLEFRRERSVPYLRYSCLWALTSELWYNPNVQF